MNTDPTTPQPSLGQRIHATLIGDRDPVLLLLIAIILLGVNGYGVVSGMNMILPIEPSIGAGIVVCGLLFAFEADYAGRHSKRIKRLGVVLLIPFVVFWMFTKYYTMAAQFRDAGELISFAATPHSDLVTIVYTPKKAVADSLARRSEEKYAASERERTSGTGTGARGYGPRAQALQREGDELRDQSAEYTAILELQKAYAEIDTATISPEKTYEITLALWRVTPEFTTTAKGEIMLWKCLRLREGTGASGVPPVCEDVIPQPTREQFVDETRQNPVLTPTLRLLAWDPVAWAVLLISLFFDGVALAAGTAIVKKEEPEPVADNRSMVERASGWLLGARQARKTLQYARNMPVEHIDIRDPLRTMHVRVVGERHAADFWNLLYRHTHPLSGRLDWAAILKHDNESFQDVARWWVDAARANGLLVDTGAEDEDEALYYPKDSYFPTTNFYREMHLREIAHRDGLPPAKDGESPERVMRVLLPDPIKRQPGAAVELMRPLKTSSRPRTTTADPNAIVTSAPPPYSAVAAAPLAAPARAAVAPPQAFVAVAPPRVATLARQTLVPPEPQPHVNRPVVSAAARSPMAFARGGVAFAVSPETRGAAPETTVEVVTVDAPALRVLPPMVEEEDVATVESTPELLEAMLPANPDDLPDISGDVTVVDADDELVDTDPSILVPVPVPAEPPPPAVFAPSFDPADWDEKPTATRSVSRSKLRAATQDGNTAMNRDDALAPGKVARLVYMTKPIVAGTLAEPHAPTLRAHVLGMAQEAFDSRVR